MTASFHDFEQLEYTISDGIATLRLDRPAALNSFTTQLYREVKNGVRLAAADPEIDIIVITGTGRAFATGGDLSETLARMEDPNPLALHAYDDNMPFETIKHCGKTTIAAVNGICVAGGSASPRCATCSWLYAARVSAFPKHASAWRAPCCRACCCQKSAWPNSNTCSTAAP